MSIEQVAKRAQVSTATVSRTINNPSAVHPETAQRVREAIQELNYYPNIQARSLVSGRSRILGLIVSDITNPFFPELIQGLEDIAVENGYEILVSSTNYDTKRMSLCIRRMLERNVEGVAIMTSEMDRANTDQLAGRNVPMVFLDVGAPGEGVSNLFVDYQAGIFQAVQHLLGLGHSRLAFISGPLRLASARVRRTVFLQALQSSGIFSSESLVVEGDHTIDGGVQAMEQLLKLPEPPTAVLTSNDLTAMGVLRAVHRKHLKVPGDVSTIGFDDIHLAGFTEPPLTTVRLSRTELAREAFRALIDLRETDPLGREYRIGTELVIRESTGPCIRPA